MNPRPLSPLRAGLHSLLRRVSRNYIAGPTLEDAQRIGSALASRGYWITLGYWDAAGDSASHVMQTYAASCENLARLQGQNYLSIKIPALGNDAVMFRTLHEKCRGKGIALHFDSLDIDRTNEIFRFLADHTDGSAGNIGCTLPGRWRRSLDDAELAISLGFVVRVVKGQSPDPAEPGRDPAAGYLSVVRKLAGRARCVRVASHDPVVTRQSLAILKAAGTPCELELLYGLPVGRQVELAREFEVPVRVYVAFGHAFLPYALESLRKNPRALLRLLREAARGDCLATFPGHVGQGIPV